MFFRDSMGASRIIRFAPFVFLAFAATAHAATVTFQAGLPDAFATPAEIGAPSAALLAWYSEPVKDFDANTLNAAVAHTFSGLPGGITAATLELRVRATGANAASDAIFLVFATPSTTANQLSAIAWGRFFGPYSGVSPLIGPYADTGLLQTTPWAPGNDRTFTLDLAALPVPGGGTVSILPQLQSNGFLDVLIDDDSAVDYLRLDVTAVPEPASAWLLAAAGFAVWRLRRSPAAR